MEKRTYAGSYTSAVDGGANGEGIYRCEMDTHTGELERRKLVAKVPNPSWIAIHPSISTYTQSMRLLIPVHIRLCQARTFSTNVRAREVDPVS
jgi:6-phosphogluconolactonase (cycloisomerase 2 family)